MLAVALTLQEYALRHHLPLDLLLNADQINQSDDVKQYIKPENSSKTSKCKMCLQVCIWQMQFSSKVSLL